MEFVTATGYNHSWFCPMYKFVSHINKTELLTHPKLLCTMHSPAAACKNETNYPTKHIYIYGHIKVNKWLRLIFITTSDKINTVHKHHK